MSRGLAERLDPIAARFAGNVRAIRNRASRVRARLVPRMPSITRSELAVLFVFAAVLVLVIGIAFDRLSVIRARELPGFVVGLFSIVSDAGKSQWELYPAGVLVLVLLFGRWSVVPRFVRVFWAEIGAIAAYVFLSIGGAGLIVNIVKQPIGRGRPPTFDEFGAFTLQPFRFDYLFQSFPSGHATTAGAIIAIGFLVAPNWRIGLLVFSLAVAASRVIVGAHYPSDVLAGLLLGFFFSLWLAGRFERMGWAFARTRSGTIRARVAGIRLVWRSRARIAVALAGLADALIGRPAWVPALASIGEGEDGDPRAGKGRRDDA